MLDPQKLGKHLPEIDFKKMLGRPGDLEVVDEREELILEPNIEAIKSRVTGGVDFNKMLGRPEEKRLGDDDIMINGELLKDPIPNDPSRPNPTHIPDFSKQADRFPDTTERLADLNPPDQLLLDIKQPFDLPKKSQVNMGKGAPRFPEPLPKDINYNEYNLEDLPQMKADLRKDPTKAAPKDAIWSKQSAGDKNKDLKTVIEE